MSVRAMPSDGGDCVTVEVALTFRRRGGRKVVQVPDGSTWAPPRARVDSTLVKAIARAHRWQRMLETGEFASVAELAAAERINPSYLARVLRLTLLAPVIVDAILDGAAQSLSLSEAMKPFPVRWDRQAIDRGRVY